VLLTRVVPGGLASAGIRSAATVALVLRELGFGDVAGGVDGGERGQSSLSRENRATSVVADP
jgi:hypothetical protein